MMLTVQVINLSYGRFTCTIHMIVYNNKSKGANNSIHMSVNTLQKSMYATHTICNNKSIKFELI